MDECFAETSNIEHSIMAKSTKKVNTMSDTNTTENTEVVAKPKRILKPRPLYTLLSVKDAEGNTVAKGTFQIEVLAHSRNAADLLKLVQANPDASLIEHVAD